LFTPNVRGRAHLAIIKVFGHEPSLHLRLLNRAKASPQDEKAVEVLPRPLQRNFADAGSGGERTNKCDSETGA